MDQYSRFSIKKRENCIFISLLNQIYSTISLALNQKYFENDYFFRRRNFCAFLLVFIFFCMKFRLIFKTFVSYYISCLRSKLHQKCDKKVFIQKTKKHFYSTVTLLSIKRTSKMRQKNTFRTKFRNILKYF